MSSVSRYGDIAEIILSDYEESAKVGQATPLEAPETGGAQISDLLPPITAGAAQAATAVFPPLRAASPLIRYLTQLGAGAGGAMAGEQIRQEVTGEQSDGSKVFAAGLENLAWDVAGNLVFKVSGQMFKVGRDRVKELLGKDTLDNSELEAKQAAQQFFTQRGTTLTEFQATGTPMSALQEGIARASILSGSVVRKIDEEQFNAVRGAVDELTASAETLTREQFGEQFKGVLQAGEEALSSWARPKYTQLDELASESGVKVRISGLKKTADNVVKQNSELAINPDVTSFLKTQILGMTGDTLTFTQARMKLSDLKAQSRNLEKSDPRQKVLKATIARLENEMEEAAKRAGDNVYQTYRQLNDEFAEVASAIRGDTVLEALSKNPERVAEYFFRDGNVTEIKDAYKGLLKIAEKNPELAESVSDMVNKFQDSYIRSVFESVVDEGTLKTALKNVRSGKGRETLAAVVEGAGKFKGVQGKAAAVEAILNAAEYSLSRPDSVMSLFIAGKEAGAVESLIRGGVAAGASIIGALPTIFARSAADPRKVNELLKINRQSLRVGFTDQVASKLVQMANELGIDLAEFGPTVEPAPSTPSTPTPPTTQSPDISDLL